MVSFGEHLVGVALLAIAFGPAIYAAVVIRHRLLAGWTGAAARVVEIVLGLTLVLVVAQVLGAVGRFERLPMALLCAASGAAIALAARRGRRLDAGSGKAEPEPPGPGVAVSAAMVVSGLLAGAWTAKAVEALNHGMLGSDTLGYHGPVAARFVQDGSVFGLLYLADDLTITYLPFNSELLHAVALLLLGTDLLSPLLNLGFLALALLSAWSLGRGYGAAPLTLSGVALVLAAPVLVHTQPGSGDTDIAGMALLLAAAAVLVRGGLAPVPLAVAGLATGLAMGTKPTTFAAVAVLTAGVLLALVSRVRARRLSGQVAAARFAGWGGALALGGGAWFLRNLVHTGNPVPWVRVDLGPVSLGGPEIYSSTPVAHYLGDFEIWKEVFFPGFRVSLGPFWWLAFLLAFAGTAIALLRGRRPAERVLGATALAAAAFYLFLPNGAAGPEGFPVFFEHAVRYVTPPLALGIALLVLWSPLRRPPVQSAAVIAAGLLVVLTLRGGGVNLFDLDRLVPTLAVTGVLIGGHRVAPTRFAVLLGSGLAAVAVLVGGYAMQRSYLDGRYAGASLGWAREFENARIGLAGSFRQYHLYGYDLSNTVRYVNVLGPGDELVPIRTCRHWRRALAEGAYRYVVTTPEEFLGSFDRRDPPITTWTRTMPGAEEIIRLPNRTTVFRLGQPADGTSC